MIINTHCGLGAKRLLRGLLNSQLNNLQSNINTTARNDEEKQTGFYCNLN
jgi:hypothetical protein